MTLAIEELTVHMESRCAVKSVSVGVVIDAKKAQRNHRGLPGGGVI